MIKQTIWCFCNEKVVFWLNAPFPKYFWLLSIYIMTFRVSGQCGYVHIHIIYFILFKKRGLCYRHFFPMKNQNSFHIYTYDIWFNFEESSSHQALCQCREQSRHQESTHGRMWGLDIYYIGQDTSLDYLSFVKYT